MVNYSKKKYFKGGYLDFFTSHRIKIEIYMKKQYKSSRIKNQKLTKKNFVDGVPFKGYVASSVIFRFGARNKKRYPVTNDA